MIEARIFRYDSGGDEKIYYRWNKTLSMWRPTLKRERAHVLAERKCEDDE